MQKRDFEILPKFSETHVFEVPFATPYSWTSYKRSPLVSDQEYFLGRWFSIFNLF